MRIIRNCTVAVTGGAGFLGSHMVNHLIEDRECNVVVIDNLCVGKREFVHKDAIFEHADISHSESYLQRIFKGYGVEYVMSYAAHPYIPVSFDRPAHVFGTNATGALNVINAAHEAGCKGILQVSSAEIYGEGALREGCSYNEDGHCVSSIDENCPVIPHSSYGASKAAIDFLVQSRWKEVKVPCIALRQFNCVGERETHPYVVPEIISQLAESERYHDGGNWDKPYSTSVYLGNNSFRDFLYAGDAVAMAAELLEKGEFGEVYNLGSEHGIHMYDLARMIGELMDFAKVDVVQDIKKVRPWEIWHLLSDNSKIYKVIKSRPSVSLENALERTIQYYRSVGCQWGWE